MAVSKGRAIFRLQSEILPRAESVTGPIGHINFDVKLSGKRSAGKSHAAFDVAGVGNGEARSTTPILDPT